MDRMVDALTHTVGAARVLIEPTDLADTRRPNEAWAARTGYTATGGTRNAARPGDFLNFHRDVFHPEPASLAPRACPNRALRMACCARSVLL